MNSKTLKLSIITVVYNDVANISETVESVVGQSYENIQHVIIDGNSTDGTHKICNEYNTKYERVSLVSEKDNGIYDAMNKGLNAATGDYVLFLNSGDTFVNEGTLTRVATYISKNKLNFYFGDNYIRFGDNEIIFNKSPDNLNKLWKRMQFSHQSLFVSLPLAKSIGYDLKYNLSADYFHILQLYLSNSSFEYFGFPIAIYRAGGVSEIRRIKSVWQRFVINLKHNNKLKLYVFYPTVLISAAVKSYAKKMIGHNRYYRLKKYFNNIKNCNL